MNGDLVLRETADGRRVVDTPALLPDRGLAGRTALSGLWTRERALVAMGFDLEHLAEAYGQTRAALTAVTPERRRVKKLSSGEIEETIEDGGAPDWKTRMEATRQMYALGGVRAVELEPDATKAPVTIKVVIGETTPAAPTTTTVTAVSVRVPR